MDRFFQDFDRAFATLDRATVAARYAAPYVACRGDGTAQAFTDQTDVATYFQEVIDGYRRLGVRSCRHRDLAISAMDDVHLLARVTWDLLDDQAHPVATWSESYLLTHHDDRLLVRASIDHPTDEPE